jgi:hypothetical protein
MLTFIPVDARDIHPFTGNGHPFVLSPGQSVEELGLRGHASPLDAWGIHLTKPGTYHVTATLTFTNIKSNTVTIVVR